jgi:uncharacterized protein (UPF0261 family)
MLDAPGQPFHDPDADGALFEAIERGVTASGNRRVTRVPGNINDAGFVSALEQALLDIDTGRTTRN